MPGAEAVVGEGVAEVDVVDVLALDDHVGLAHRIGARVDILAVEHRAGLGVHLDQVVVGRRQHAAGSCSGVVDGAHGAGFSQCVVFGVEQDVDHQRDDFTGGEVITGLGGVGLGELADEFLEDVAHVVPGDHLGVQIDGGELFDDQIQPVGLGQLGDLVEHPEALEDVAHVGREVLDVVDEVVGHPLRVTHQGGEGPAGGVVEGQLELGLQQHSGSTLVAGSSCTRPAPRPWSAPGCSPGGAGS